MSTPDLIQLITILEPVLLEIVRGLIDLARAALEPGETVARQPIVDEALQTARNFYDAGMFVDEFGVKFTWPAGDDAAVEAYLHGLVGALR